MNKLKSLTKLNHENASEYLRDASDEQLKEYITVPWLKDPLMNITIEQALTQCVMHSNYHRGQNASRLRELGGNPPLTDFIIWIWRKKPQAVWDLANI